MSDHDDLLNLKVLGTATSGYDVVVSALHRHLKKANIPYRLNEVTDVAIFLEEGLESVPAIQLDGQVLNINANGDYNRSLRKAINTILKRKNYGDLPRMILPVDFSDVSTSAFMYGHRLATEVGAVVKALHIYFPHSKELADAAIADIDFTELRKSQFEDFVSSFDLDWGSDLLKNAFIDSEFKVGFPADEIISSAEDDKVLMVVMGTTGDSGKIKKWFGSVSTRVMKEAKCPVLLIPENANYKGVKNIMYAYNDLELDRDILDQLLSIGGACNSNLHLVHIEEENEPDTGYLLKELVKNKYPKSKIYQVSLSNRDIVDGLNNYAKNHEIDIISMATKSRNFFERIFHESTSKQMALHTDLPLLVLT